MNLNSLLKRSLAAALLAGLVLAATVVCAQPDPKPSSPKKSHYSLEIDGGFLMQSTGDKVEATLENVVERLRELEFGHHRFPNVVLSPDLPTIKIANLKLANTSLTQGLEALRVASGERFTWSTGENPYAMVDPATGLPVNVPADETLYILRPAPEAGRSRLRVEAFSLAGYFESRKKGDDEEAYLKMIVEEVHQIMEIVLETMNLYTDLNRRASGGEAAFGKAPSFRFHRGANLLVVMGEPETVEMAAKVIGALPHVHRSGGDATSGFGGGMGVPGMTSPAAAAEAFRSRYGIAPQPGLGAPPVRH